MKKHLVSLLVLFLLVSTSLVGVSNPQKREFSPIDTIIWDNHEPTDLCPSELSQYDQVYPFNAQAADDFVFESDMQIDGVQWWGVFNSGTPPWPNPMPFNIIFYADDGTGTMPTGAGMDDPTPTALAIYDFDEVYGQLYGMDDEYGVYNVTLSTPFNATANTKYWIAIQAVLVFPPLWDWRTNGENPDQLHIAVIGNPAVLIQYWTNSWYGDMAFNLRGRLNYAPLPPVIHGTFIGDVNIEYEFWTDPITDPSGDSLYIRWDWDNGNITNWLGPYSSGSIVYASHAWEDAGVYDIRAQLKGAGGESNWSEPHTITIVQNQPPSTPIVTGPSQGKRGISYNYDIESLDPENENISYYIDWADGTNTGWIGPFLSGQEQTLNHTWNKKGTYTIKAKAQDIHDQESDWGTLTVTMPYEPPQFPFIQWLLERFPHAFPLLRYFLQQIGE